MNVKECKYHRKWTVSKADSAKGRKKEKVKTADAGSQIKLRIVLENKSLNKEWANKKEKEKGKEKGLKRQLCRPYWSEIRIYIIVIQRGLMRNDGYLDSREERNQTDRRDNAFFHMTIQHPQPFSTFSGSGGGDGGAI